MIDGRNAATIAAEVKALEETIASQVTLAFDCSGYLWVLRL